jgi:hypothetical protein
MYKIEDLTREYLIKFLDEYSKYINSAEKMRNDIGLNHIKLRVPSEFFEETYLNMLQDNNEHIEAFEQQSR